MIHWRFLSEDQRRLVFPPRCRLHSLAFRRRHVHDGRGARVPHFVPPRRRPGDVEPFAPLVDRDAVGSLERATMAVGEGGMQTGDDFPLSVSCRTGRRPIRLVRCRRVLRARSTHNDRWDRGARAATYWLTPTAAGPSDVIDSVLTSNTNISVPRSRLPYEQQKILPSAVSPVTARTEFARIDAGGWFAAAS